MPQGRPIERNWAPAVALFWLLGMIAAVLAQTPGQAPGRGGRGMPAMPRKGVCPLPVFFAKAGVPHGKVERATYKNYNGDGKRMHTYLPPDYESHTSADALKQFDDNFSPLLTDPRTNDLFRVPYYMAAVPVSNGADHVPGLRGAVDGRRNES